MEENTFRYRGVDFPYLPKSVQLQRERKLARLFSPVSGPVVQDMGFLPAVITGEGELFGPEAGGQLRSIRELFEAPGKGLLQIPGQPVLWAYFSGLSVSQRAGPQVIRYRFTFLEDGGGPWS